MQYFPNVTTLLVPLTTIIECFKRNTSLVNGYPTDPALISWFIHLNSVCKLLNASTIQRRSVPIGQMSYHDNQLRKFMEEMVKSSEAWKKMKLVVLGHGRYVLPLYPLSFILYDPMHPSLSVACRFCSITTLGYGFCILRVRVCFPRQMRVFPCVLAKKCPVFPHSCFTFFHPHTLCPSLIALLHFYLLCLHTSPHNFPSPSNTHLQNENQK